jgi:hypothetical protein
MGGIGSGKGSGGVREGAGRKPYLDDPRKIKRTYNFNNEELELIKQAVDTLEKKGKSIAEAEFVRTAIIKEAKRILKAKI